MTIELSETVVTSKILKVGDDNFQVTAGKSLKIETSPSGMEILNVIVPEGKVWRVTAYVSIVETDA